MSLPTVISIDRSIRFVDNAQGYKTQSVTVINIQFADQVISVPAYPEAYEMLTTDLNSLEVNPQHILPKVNAPPLREYVEKQVLQEIQQEVDQTANYYQMLNDGINIQSI